MSNPQDIELLGQPLQALESVVVILEKFQIPYLIGGSFASGARSQFRATNDLDVLCKFTLQTLKNFMQEIKVDFFADEQYAIEAFNAGRSFNLIYEKAVFKVDIFTKIGPFEELQLARATTLPLPNLSIHPKFATAEDIILAKLIWYRKGGEQSERQLNDIALVITHNNDRLDIPYLTNQAKTLGVLDLWERLKKVER